MSDSSKQPRFQPTVQQPSSSSSSITTVQDPQLLNEEYTIDTPENVTFGYEVAGIGSRFIGALADTVILGLLLLLLNFVFFLGISLLAPDGSDSFPAFDNEDESMWAVGLAIAAYALLNFVILWGYYIFFELSWRGQTPGKRLAGIRVIRMDGNSIGFLDNVIRNLIRILDFLPFGYGLGLIVMFCNRRSRRLGDYAAGTLVVHDKPAETFEDLFGSPLESDKAAQNRNVLTDAIYMESLSDTISAPSAPSDPLRARFAHIQHLSSLDYELVVDTLQRHESSEVAPELLHRLVELMSTKLAMDESIDDERQFLIDLAEAYRRYHR